MNVEMAIMVLSLIGVLTVSAQDAFEKDVLKTSAGDLEITFIGHGTLMLKFEGKILHVDPYSRLADYSKQPKADMILITHDHPDHLDPAALQKVRATNTTVIVSAACAGQVDGALVMKNGDVRTVMGIKIEAVPAYNVVNKRDGGQPFHPPGAGNGYVLTLGDTRVYIAGDTENTLEMKALTGIDCAFLPMNLPYTMTPEMVADAAKAFKPKILYPYHYGKTDSSTVVKLLKDNPGIDVRIRKME